MYITCKTCMSTPISLSGVQYSRYTVCKRKLRLHTAAFGEMGSWISTPVEWADQAPLSPEDCNATCSTFLFDWNLERTKMQVERNRMVTKHA